MFLIFYGYANVQSKFIMATSGNVVLNHSKKRRPSYNQKRNGFKLEITNAILNNSPKVFDGDCEDTECFVDRALRIDRPSCLLNHASRDYLPVTFPC